MSRFSARFPSVFSRRGGVPHLSRAERALHEMLGELERARRKYVQPAAHAAALHLLLIVWVGVHHVLVELDTVLLCERHFGCHDGREDAAHLLVHLRDVEPPGFLSCGDLLGQGGQRGNRGWGCDRRQAASLSSRAGAQQGAVRVNVNGPLYYVGK